MDGPLDLLSLVSRLADLTPPGKAREQWMFSGSKVRLWLPGGGKKSISESCARHSRKIIWLTPSIPALFTQ